MVYMMLFNDAHKGSKGALSPQPLAEENDTITNMAQNVWIMPVKKRRQYVYGLPPPRESIVNWALLVIFFIPYVY